MRVLHLAALMALVGLCFAAPASATRRALLIGIADYAPLPVLDNPRVDIGIASKKLLEVGYQVTIVPPQDNTRDRLLGALDRFMSTIAENDVVLVYYAGHGIDIKGDDELVPADAPAPGAVLTDGVLKGHLIAFHDLMQEIQDRSPSVQVWIIDACRNNPYAVGSRGGGKAGLQPIDKAQGRYVLYSADYNQAAVDRLPSDRNRKDLGSPFARTFAALFDESKHKDIDVFRREIGARLGPLVSPLRQSPTAENGMDSEWCIGGCANGPTQVAVTADPASSSQEVRTAIKSASGLSTFTFQAAHPAAGSVGGAATTGEFLTAVADNRGVVFLGKRSAAGCASGSVSDLYPFGCETVRSLRAHFDAHSTDLAGGLVGQSLTATSAVNVRKGLPRPQPGGTAYGCRVRILGAGGHVTLSSTVAMQYLGDTFYWGVISGPDVTCAAALAVTAD